ncbi:MAG: OB-fold nucleic acid binding domain-containing protein [Anaerolineae bacterium]|nr:OB-fold nucleic acid binding domain-containing protein [Anaerolineae bacterium]
MVRDLLYGILTLLIIGVIGCTSRPGHQVTTTVSLSSPTATPAPTVTPSRTPTFTLTPSPTATYTPFPTPTRTATPPPTATPSPTRTPAPTATPTVELISMGSLSVADVGREVTVEGEVVGVASFSAGFKFTLEDGTGDIVLLMWHNVYDDCWDAREINLGARVRAKGKVAQYEEELQVQPDFGGDVRVIEQASERATLQEIGSITGGDEGKRVMIEGEVIRVSGLRNAVVVSVGDGTGEIPVFIWRNILDRIRDNTGLGTPGARVRVVGVVTVYRGNLEIVPALPVDVTVLALP